MTDIKNLQNILRSYGAIDFETIREEWGFYKIDDGTLLRVKLVLVNVLTRDDLEYSFAWSNVIGVIAPPELRGPPSNKRYSSEELITSIEAEDLEFKELKKGISEYVLENGVRVSVRPVLAMVSRTNKYDTRGMPIYVTNVQPIWKIKPMKIKK